MKETSRIDSNIFDVGWCKDSETGSELAALSEK